MVSPRPVAAMMCGRRCLGARSSQADITPIVRPIEMLQAMQYQMIACQCWVCRCHAVQQHCQGVTEQGPWWMSHAAKVA